MFAESRRCEAGARWHWDGVEFTVLHPSIEIYAETRKRKENDRGCVVRVATAYAENAMEQIGRYLKVRRDLSMDLSVRSRV